METIENVDSAECWKHQQCPSKDVVQVTFGDWHNATGAKLESFTLKLLR